ncbi:BMC domain-containing protein [Brevibacillus fluminis]|uniref:BMC domain-containing protein n=2 Tax=Brevibacillus fluminis TaxID=511487 RepID=A0A3M8DX01_9BACL|nr:BMC domain-containing protein [Brevibacillus fluminis]
MIETIGFPALIAAADAAAKAADVQIITYQQADAGIVTIYIIGDVAAVQAAVATGEAAAMRVGRLRHSHVIARPDQSVQQLIKRLESKSAPTVASKQAQAKKKPQPPLLEATGQEKRGEDEA